MSSEDVAYRYAAMPGKPWQRKIPPAWIERLHRWWYRCWYAQLPEYYRDFYPFSNALSLTLQYAKHQIESAESMDRLASQSLRRVVDLEKAITELRLAMASAQSGWNEDQVDHFTATWFGRRDLPTSEAKA